MPNIITVFALVIWMFHSCRIATRNKMRNIAVGSGRGVPEYLGRSTIIHRRRPNCKDSVVRNECAIVKQRLMLSHSVVQWNIVILAPSAERMKQQNRVLVPLGKQLLTRIIEHKHMTVMQWISHLEGIDCISIPVFDCFVDLLWRHSVMIHSVVELDISNEMHALARNEEVALCENSFDLRMRLAKRAKHAGRDLFFPVLKKDWLFNDGQQVIRKLRALDANFAFALESLFFFSSNMLSDWDTE